MNNAEFIRRYGEELFLKRQRQTREWATKNQERKSKREKTWRINNPEKVREANREHNQKGGKYYEKAKKYKTTGVPGERHNIRIRHAAKWRQYKRIIAPDSQIPHSWYPRTANYEGIALVEADIHMHGFIDVIQILEGKITLFTEKEIREQGESGSAF